MYDYGVVGVLYSSLHIALMASVRYWLYKERLRVPFKWMVCLLTALVLCSGGLWLGFGGIPGISFDAYRVLLALCMFLLSCCIIQAPVTEHAFSYAFILAGDAAIETIAFYVQSKLTGAWAAYAYPVTSALITLAILIPAVKSLKSMITRLSALESDRIWGWLDMACFAFLLMNLLVTLPHPADITLFYPVGRGMMLLGMAGVYKASVRIMDAMRATADARAELALTRRRVAMQQSYYDRLVAQMDEVRRMHHDLRHHRAALAALVRSGDRAALDAYIDATDTEEAPPVSGNLTVDSVLLYYLDAAKALDVQVETDLVFGRETPVSDPDLCVILGNLLENAVEAQKYVEPDKRLIRVAAKGDAASLALAVDNRFDGALRRDESGEYLSRKTGEGHGVGLMSVRTVCEKYGGVLQIETEGDLFMAGVVIGL